MRIYKRVPCMYLLKTDDNFWMTKKKVREIETNDKIGRGKYRISECHIQILPEIGASKYLLYLSSIFLYIPRYILGINTKNV